ncbi:hypothetical protein [Cytophaga aurantiaca]|uniref:hypothetical protein n=1 Tax=Cytophaga aurantiaca TaxID=29530 RepID=UPI00037DFFBE|nr:hypothetical protein [Cytophaga aurantiaca]
MVAKHFSIAFICGLICIVCTSTTSIIKQSQSANGILTWEYKREGLGKVPIESAFVLCLYEKTDSGYKKKELLKTGYYIPHYSDFHSQIIQNRYLVNSKGDIIDLVLKTVIFDHINGDIFEDISGDSVFFNHIPYNNRLAFRVNDSIRHAAIKSSSYFFDLQKCKIEELPSNRNIDTLCFAVHGFIRISKKKSPCRMYEATFVSSNEYDGWYLDDDKYSGCGLARMFPTKGFIVVTEVKSGVQIIKHPAIFNFGLRTVNNLPIHWINDSLLLSHEENGNIILINVEDGSVQSFEKLKLPIQHHYPPYFKTDLMGNIFYYCSVEGEKVDQFKINIEKLTLSPSNTFYLSKEFQMLRSNNDPRSLYDTKYLFHGNEIIKDNGLTPTYSLSHNKLSFQLREIVPSRNQYDHWNSIMIFDAQNKKIERINIEYLKQFVGWY